MNDAHSLFTSGGKPVISIVHKERWSYSMFAILASTAFLNI
ncbi:hypothetical protein ACFFNY_03625 [Paenibacillus hodogayensis]|uniref:Uncharacterized protein n=1 Tax=Paenibacillus hodogayensis TaxID=279208 RepID=A0ABV5VR69_9BACL